MFSKNRDRLLEHEVMETGAGGRNAQANWKGKARSNDTHASTTDPDARQYRNSKAAPALMAYQGHVLMENRSGLVMGAVVTHADGYGERAAAVAMLRTVPGSGTRTVGATRRTTRRTSLRRAAARA